jgi:hypothetical protein
MERMLCDHRVVERFVRPSGRSITVPPGIQLKPIIEASIPISTSDASALGEGDLAHANMRLEYSAATGRYEIAAFGIDRRNADIEITGSLWRTVRVRSITRAVIEIALPLWVEPITILRLRGMASAGKESLPLDLDGNDLLLLTAIVYRIAEISSENPALAVSETLGLKQRTATNWIQRARDAGYLSTLIDPADPRRVAEAIERQFPRFPKRSPEEIEEDLARLRRIPRRSRNGND